MCDSVTTKLSIRYAHCICKLTQDHMSAAWSRTGRKGLYAGYYIHIQPNGRTFLASGLNQRVLMIEEESGILMQVI